MFPAGNPYGEICGFGIGIPYGKIDYPQGISMLCKVFEKKLKFPAKNTFSLRVNNLKFLNNFCVLIFVHCSNKWTNQGHSKKRKIWIATIFGGICPEILFTEMYEFFNIFANFRKKFKSQKFRRPDVIVWW